MFPVEIDAMQLLIIGMICTLLIGLLRFVVEKTGWTPNLVAIGIISGVVSIALAVYFVWQVIPPAPESGDFMELANYVIIIASGILGFATLIYNVILKKLLDALGQQVTKLMAK